MKTIFEVLLFFFLSRASAPTASSAPEVLILHGVIGGSGNDFDVT